MSYSHTKTDFFVNFGFQMHKIHEICQNLFKISKTSYNFKALFKRLSSWQGCYGPIVFDWWHRTLGEVVSGDWTIISLQTETVDARDTVELLTLIDGLHHFKLFTEHLVTFQWRFSKTSYRILF